MIAERRAFTLGFVGQATSLETMARLKQSMITQQNSSTLS